jgi:hypothetical protein
MGSVVDELHRMLGSARAADFEQEAANRRLAKDARRGVRKDDAVAETPAPRPRHRGWFLAFLTRESRARA